VASAGTVPDRKLFQSYEDELNTALSTRPSSKRHANVLYHALGYLKKLLSPFEKQELVQLIEDYRRGLVPLIVPNSGTTWPTTGFPTSRASSTSNPIQRS
jgi:uncharacterized protein YbgA (DUF1722 family)